MGMGYLVCVRSVCVLSVCVVCVLSVYVSVYVVCVE